MKRDYFDEISSSKAVKNRRVKKRFMKDKEAVVGFFQKAKKTVQDYRDGAEERDRAATERYKQKTKLLKAKADYKKAKGSGRSMFDGGNSMFGGGSSMKEPAPKSWSIGGDTSNGFAGSWSVGMEKPKAKPKRKRSKPKYKKVVYYR